MGDERQKYMLPRGGVAAGREAGERLMTAFGVRSLGGEDKDRNLFTHLGMRQPDNWNETKWRLELCEVDFWQSTVPWPRA